MGDPAHTVFPASTSTSAHTTPAHTLCSHVPLSLLAESSPAALRHIHNNTAVAAIQVFTHFCAACKVYTQDLSYLSSTPLIIIISMIMIIT